MKEFTVVDLSPQCEVRATASYAYELLDRIEGAGELMGTFSSFIWRTPEEFEVPLFADKKLIMRWRASAEGVGILTLQESGQTLSISVLASGLDEQADQVTIQTFHTHILRELHDTGIEPAFDLLQLSKRPLLATVGLFAPSGDVQRWGFAVADRCFAAAYFRRLGLA